MRGILFWWIIPAILGLLLPWFLFGCDGRDRPSDGYVDTQVEGGSMYRVGVFCPGQPEKIYLVRDGLSSNSTFVSFSDYQTGTKVETSCPVFAIKLREKKKDDQKNLSSVLNDPQNSVPGSTSVVAPKNGGTPSSTPEQIIINNHIGTQNNQ